MEVKENSCLNKHTYTLHVWLSSHDFYEKNLISFITTFMDNFLSCLYRWRLDSVAWFESELVCLRSLSFFLTVIVDVDDTVVVSVVAVAVSLRLAISVVKKLFILSLKCVVCFISVFPHCWGLRHYAFMLFSISLFHFVHSKWYVSCFIVIFRYIQRQGYL